jgi:predicted ATPase
MPLLKKFIIKNFKGIQEAEISIDVKKTSDVITLIGLNESGKTTILEALSHFSTGDRTIANLTSQANKPEHLISLIPIAKRAAFTGKITITAEIELTDKEQRKYLKIAEEKFDLNILPKNDLRLVTVTKEYTFKDSVFEKATNVWGGAEIKVKAKNKIAFQDYVRPENLSEDIWVSLVNSIRDDLFELVYFPTFIVDMPARIYIEEHDGETPINLYYRKVIEHVVNSVGEGIDLKRHVIDRIKDAKGGDGNLNWLSIFFGKPERSLVDSVFNKIQSAINREVIGSWSKVFKQAIAARSVKLEWNVDAEKADKVYISFNISDGQSTFAIHERSLGFRWFFSYLLFTQFRSKSGRKTIFLFDEPAANLHAKAQIELLESIARIVGSGNKVIYSTHSPHMINPLWLSDAFIVENKAIDIDKGDDIFGLDTKPTDIKVSRYGNFVSNYPEKRTYFQPVWEKLLYETPPIIGTGPFLCLEGISDFHFLSYANFLLEEDQRVCLIPGVGAGGFSGTLPSLYGAGANFILLLDDDVKGKSEKNRYVKERIISEDRVYTLGDVDVKLVGKKLEQLIDSQTLKMIADRFEGKRGKKQIAMYLAEAAASKAANMFCEESISIAQNILRWASQRLGKLS